jgi:hypothetical protein
LVLDGCFQMKAQILLPFIFLFSFHFQASEVTYYVAPDGDDARTATQAQSPETPWRTISKATAQAQAGDTIIVADGVYEEGNIAFPNSGIPSAWITLKSAPDATPVITKPGELRGIFVYERSYIHIDGFTLNGFDNDGISIFWSDHIICEDIHAYDNGNAGIEVVGTNYVIVQDSVLHHNGWNPESGWGDGLSINNHHLFGEVDQWYSVVRRNLMYANWQKNDRVWDGNGLTLDQAGTGGVHIMANNVFFNNGGHGMLNATTGNMAIVHNVLFRDVADYNTTHSMGDLLLSNDWVGNTLMKNNIVYARPRTAYYEAIYPLIRDGDPDESESIENNLIWGENEEDTRVYWLQTMSIGDWISSKAPTTLTGDPGFISAPFDNNLTTFHGAEWIEMDVENYDFNLRSDSQCVDAGAFLTFTTNAGSGTYIVVDSARYFTDGFGKEGQGDVIRIGSNEPVQIVGIDYDTNVITVGREITWKEGDGVGFPFYGARPDVGAFEYRGEDSTFADVPLDHPYHDYIEALYQNGYVAGCSTDSLMYCPERIMNRAESSVFVERGIHGVQYDPTDPTVVVFGDVALEAWYADWVHGLWDDGYTAGCGTDPLIYCPDQEHTRAEGCVFYLRMMYGADYEPEEGAGTFVDVDPEMWYAKWVDAAWEAGIVEACETEPELRFCPEEGLTRAVAAYMMVQAKGLIVP